MAVRQLTRWPLNVRYARQGKHRQLYIYPRRGPKGRWMFRIGWTLWRVPDAS